MYDYNRSYPERPIAPQAAVRPTVLGQVLGLLGFSFVCTAAGAWLGTALGPGAFIPALIISFGALIALYVVRERSPFNLGLLYTFATAEGVMLGLFLQSYLTRGLGGLVIDAAATTAALTLAAGAYGVTMHRDLAQLGGFLVVGLLGVVVAALLGLVIHLPLLYLGISLAAAVLFTGFLVYDVNRVANTALASTGDAIVLTVNIYLDIYNLFVNLLTILQVLGGSERE